MDNMNNMDTDTVPEGTTKTEKRGDVIVALDIVGRVIAILAAGAATWMLVEHAVFIRGERLAAAERRRQRMLATTTDAKELLGEAEKLLGEIRAAKEADPKRLQQLAEALHDSGELLEKRSS